MNLLNRRQKDHQRLLECLSSSSYCPGLTGAERQRPLNRAVVSGLLAGLICLSFGCEGGSHEHLVNHHRPTDFKSAVIRLEEMHQVLISQSELPPPRQFEDFGHNHSHAAGEDVSHSHAESGQIVEVGLFQEYFDVVRWLPVIAADSDLPQVEWEQINQHCRSLSRLLDDVKKQVPHSDTGKLRDRYRQSAEPIGQQIESLVGKFEMYDQWETKIVN